MSSYSSNPPNPKGRDARPLEPTFLPKFPANFGLEFSNWALKRYGSEDSLVLDPFSGSSTALLSAKSRGLHAVGLELNPIWVTYGRARLVSFTKELRSETDRLLSKLTLDSGRLSKEGLVDLFSEVLEDDSGQKDRSRALVAAAILIRAREKMRPSYGRNHSWPSVRGGSRISLLKKDISSVLERAFTHAKWVNYGLSCQHEPSLLRSDARESHRFIEDASLILTSPPYLSRLDYIRSSLPEFEYLEQLGVPTGHEELRADQIGSVIVRGESKPSIRSLPQGCENLLRKIENHPSKGSKSYYSKFVRKYLVNVREVFKSVTKAATESATLVTVVQDSWYKDLPVGTSDLLEEILEEEGWSRVTKWSFDVRSHLGLLNPHSRTWRQGSRVCESVTAFRRGGHAG